MHHIHIDRGKMHCWGDDLVNKTCMFKLFDDSRQIHMGVKARSAVKHYILIKNLM